MDKTRRKELAYDYTHSHRAMGAYRIYNVQDDKSFVGSSVNLEGIWNRHKFMLDAGLHDNKAMQADWKNYGEVGFRFEVLEQIKPEEDFVQDVSDLTKYRKMLPDLETKWLEKLTPYGERGYHKLR